MSIKICYKCKAPLVVGASFCSGCGSAIKKSTSKRTGTEQFKHSQQCLADWRESERVRARQQNPARYLAIGTIILVVAYFWIFHMDKVGIV